MNSWCDEINVTDKTLRKYLEECVQKQASASYDGYVSFTNGAIKANQTFGQSLIGIGKVLGKNLLVFAAVTAATWAIGKLFEFIDSQITTTEEYKEKLSELNGEYESLSSELKSLNDELATTESRMKELSSKGLGNLSFAEKEEYDNLVKQNNELERKIALLEKEEQAKRKERNETFLEAVEDKAISTEDFDDKFSEYTDLAKQLSTLENISREGLSDLAIAEIESQENNLRYLMENLSEDFWESLDEFEDFIESSGVTYTINPEIGSDEEAINKYLDSFYNMQDKLLIAEGSESEKTNAFNRLVDNWQFDEATQGLQDLGQEGKVTASTIEEALKYPDDKLELFIDKLVEIGVIDSKDNLEDIASAFNKVAEEAKKAVEETTSFIGHMSNVDKMSTGFDQLSGIYSDIQDGGDFDYSSILNNEGFNEAFGSYKEEYDNFIQTIANSPKDIDACQSAFNELATAYVYGQDALAGVTDETRDATILWLQQKGITNAQAIVDKQLTYNTELLTNAQAELNALKEKGIGISIDLENATLEEIGALIEEAEEADLTTVEIAEFVAQKINANRMTIATDGDVKALVNLCNSLGIATDAMSHYVKAKDALNKMSMDAPELYGVNYQEYYAQLEADIAREEANLQKKLQAIINNQNKIYTNYSPSVGSGSGSSSGSSSSGSESEEVIDHIATKIERLERQIESLGKTAGATYKDWQERNEALSDQITLTTEEIALQEEALAYYQKKANSVGLSKEYQDLVKYGGIRIDTIKDENLSKKISEYQEWYEKILACEDAIEDLNAELANLAKQKFDNISSEFDNKFSSIEHEMNVLEALIDKTETRGHVVSTKYYESLIEAEKKNIELLEKEYEQLIDEFSNAMETGDIEEGSEDFYAMKETINEVKLEIIEANTSLIEFENSIRDLEWENFDRLQEKISAITDEAEFLISLMEDSDLYDDNGQLTDIGMATMGLHAQNYNVLMNQANQYADEIGKINADLANDPNNQELLDRKQELIELQRESILAANDEKMAIKDMVQEGINLELEVLQERIDKIKETQEEMQALYEYQKKVSEQTKNIANLEKQLSAYEGDDSEENQARIQQIKLDLEEARKTIEETETEYALSETQKMLDSLYSEYEEILNNRLDNIDALIGDMIESTNANASTINETLIAESEKVGYTISDSIQDIWSNEGVATAIVTKYGDEFNSQLTSVNNVLNAIATEMGAIVEESDKEAEEAIKTETAQPEIKPSEPKPSPTTPPPSSDTKKEETKSITVGGKINAGNAKIYDYAGDKSPENQYYSKDPIYVVLKEKDGYLQVRHHSLKSGITGWFKKSDVKAYKTGGLADETGLAWLDGTKSKPEMVLNAKDTKNYMELTDILRKATRDDSILFDNDKFMKNIEELSNNLKPEFNSFIAKLPHMNTDGFMGNMNNVFNMNFELHEVQSGRDVVNFLIKDKTFENAIQAMTVDRLAGGSKFAKSKYYKG